MTDISINIFSRHGPLYTSVEYYLVLGTVNLSGN